MNLKQIVCANFEDKNPECEDCRENGINYQCQYLRLAEGLIQGNNYKEIKEIFKNE
jgi:hypothetical protein